MHAESAGEGRGATFTVLLPTAPAGESIETPPDFDSEPYAQDEEVGNLRGITALVVDDEPDEREVLAHVLRRAGATVSTACDVREAMNALERNAPDVLISDIAMPGEDGYDLMHLIRRAAEQAGGNGSSPKWCDAHPRHRCDGLRRRRRSRGPLRQGIVATSPNLLSLVS